MYKSTGKDSRITTAFKSLAIQRRQKDIIISLDVITLWPRPFSLEQTPDIQSDTLNNITDKIYYIHIFVFCISVSVGTLVFVNVSSSSCDFHNSIFKPFATLVDLLKWVSLQMTKVFARLNIQYIVCDIYSSQEGLLWSGSTLDKVEAGNEWAVSYTHLTLPTKRIV